jgi:hypothetical protein
MTYVLDPGYRGLMAAVVLRMVADYNGECESGQPDPTYREEAEEWLFDDSPESDNDVFGFHSIAKMLGINIRNIRSQLMTGKFNKEKNRCRKIGR